MAGYTILAIFIAVLVVARTRFVRHRRSLPVYAEWKIAKSRLPEWVKIVETTMVLIFLFVFAALLAVILIVVATIAGVRPTGSGVNALIPLTCFVASIGPATLLANAVSMSIPALRRANAQAFSGLQTASVRLANKNLRQMSAVLVPYGLAFALLGLFWPKG
jgi:membrane protein required for beta-lactamase induction